MPAKRCQWIDLQLSVFAISMEEGNRRLVWTVIVVKRTTMCGSRSSVIVRAASGKNPTDQETGSKRSI